jgi:hypothetical protein
MRPEDRLGKDGAHCARACIWPVTHGCCIVSNIINGVLHLEGSMHMLTSAWADARVFQELSELATQHTTLRFSSESGTGTYLIVLLKDFDHLLSCRRCAVGKQRDQERHIVNMLLWSALRGTATKPPDAVARSQCLVGALLYFPTFLR